MTNLNWLNVSLTKHGAHKIAPLLVKYGADGVLKHLHDDALDISIDEAQAKKNLSADSDGNVPKLWDDARAMGRLSVDALTLVAIVSSHHELIEALKAGAGTEAKKGFVARDKVLSGKAYTNFAHILSELGYGKSSDDGVSFDFRSLFGVPGLSSLARQLLNLKLRAAGWDRSNTLEDELIRLEFHKVFNTSPDDLRAWLIGTPEPFSTEDLKFFSRGDDKPSSWIFVFKPGHKARKTGSVSISRGKGDGEQTLLHNELQTALFEDLKREYGEDCVGTEVPASDACSIDLVVKTDKFCWFYEIKTADSVRACIRQAVPQLLEYCCWPSGPMRAHKLIIVSPHKVTKEANDFLVYLRNEFKLPFEYMQFDGKAVQPVTEPAK